MTAYIAEMRMLPPPVREAFKEGDFAISLTAGCFNRVDPDHAQEWLIADAKDFNSGLVGILSNEHALQKWALTFTWIGDVCNRTLELFDISPRNDIHPELYPSRQQRDAQDEDRLLEVFSLWQVPETDHPTSLRNFATKDVATAEICNSLMTAAVQGRSQVCTFVKERFCSKEPVSYHAKIQLNKALTFETLHQKLVASKEVATKKARKDERDTMSRLLSAYDGKRPINLREIVSHELTDVPFAIAKADGSLNTGNKSDIMRVIIGNVKCPPEIPHQEDSHLIIDGMALIWSLSKAVKGKWFKDFADMFCSRMQCLGSGYARVTVLMDR